MTVTALIAPACGHAAAKVRRGLCPTCYSRLRSTGAVARVPAQCACGRPVHGLGLCSACYQRLHYRRLQALPPEPETAWSVADVAGAFGLPLIAVLRWIWDGALAATRHGDRYAIGDGALHAFLWRAPALWQDAPVRDRAWVDGLLWDADLCKSATEPADVRALRKAAFAAQECAA